MITFPAYLTHYYEAARGPFRSLSDLPLEEAEAVLERIRREGEVFASQRAADYLAIRRGLEDRVRELFIAKGGKPQRQRPHYFIFGSCPWLLGWYKEGRELQIPLNLFDPCILSFTYGDTFPAMRIQDGKPHRGQVYILSEIPDLVQRYGLPQDCNKEGKLGPERYIEAQVWSDEPVSRYRQQVVSISASERPTH